MYNYNNCVLTVHKINFHLDHCDTHYGQQLPPLLATYPNNPDAAHFQIDLISMTESSFPFQYDGACRSLISGFGDLSMRIILLPVCTCMGGLSIISWNYREA